MDLSAHIDLINLYAITLLWINLSVTALKMNNKGLHVNNFNSIKSIPKKLYWIKL